MSKYITKKEDLIQYINQSNYKYKTKLISYIRKDKRIYTDELCDVFKIIIDESIEFNQIEKTINASIELHSLIKEEDLYNKLLPNYLKHSELNYIYEIQNIYYIFSDKKNIEYIIDIFENLRDEYELSEDLHKEDIEKIYNYIMTSRKYYIDETAFLSSIMNIVDNLNNIVHLDEYIQEKIEEDKRLSGLYDVDESTLERLSKENKKLKKELSNSNDQIIELNNAINESKTYLESLLKEYNDLKILINNCKNEQNNPSEENVENEEISKDDYLFLSIEYDCAIEDVKELIKVFGKEKVLRKDEEFINALNKIRKEYNSSFRFARSEISEYNDYHKILYINPDFKLYYAKIFNHLKCYTIQELAQMDEKHQKILDVFERKPFNLKDEEFKNIVEKASINGLYVNYPLFNEIYYKNIDLTLEQYVSYDYTFQEKISDVYFNSNMLNKRRRINKLINEYDSEQLKIENNDEELLEKLEFDLVKTPEPENPLDIFDNDYKKKIINVFGEEKIMNLSDNKYDNEFINALRLISSKVKVYDQESYLKRYKELLSLNPDFKLKYPVILHSRIYDLRIYYKLYKPYEIAFRDIDFQKLIDDIYISGDFTKTYFEDFDYDIIEALYHSKKENYISGEIFEIIPYLDSIEDYINLPFDKQKKVLTISKSGNNGYNKIKKIIDHNKENLEYLKYSNSKAITVKWKLLSEYHVSKKYVDLIIDKLDIYDRYPLRWNIGYKSLDTILSSIKEIVEFCNDDIDLLAKYILYYKKFLSSERSYNKLHKVENPILINCMSINKSSYYNEYLFQKIFGIIVDYDKTLKLYPLEKYLADATDLYVSLINNKGNIIRNDLEKVLDDNNLTIEEYINLDIESQQKLYDELKKEQEKVLNNVMSFHY